MSRYNTTNTNSVLTNLTHSMRTQAERQYKAEIKQHHLLCKTAAKRLSPADAVGLEHVLMMQTSSTNNNKDDAILTEQQVQEFMTEQRDRLRALAAGNVQDERTVDGFVQALQQLESSSNNDNGDSNTAKNLDYYETKIRQLMQQQQQHQQQAATAGNSHALDMEQETWYREICNELGVPLAAVAKRRGNGNNNDDDDDDDDDDIEVMGGNTTQLSELKCPLTAQLLEEPVRSKLCRHVYSKQAVERYIITGNHTCPAVGCNNHHLTLQQLEADLEKEIDVRRYRRTQSLQAQQLASQAEGLVDSDDEA